MYINFPLSRKAFLFTKLYQVHPLKTESGGTASKNAQSYTGTMTLPS